MNRIKKNFKKLILLAKFLIKKLVDKTCQKMPKIISRRVYEKISKTFLFLKQLHLNNFFYNIKASDKASDEENKEAEIANKVITYGIKSLIVFFIIFLSWAIFVPIKSAAIADGTVVLDFNKKIIQHLEGGIIDKIFVIEGQEVKAGDLLINLRDTKTKSEEQIVTKRLWTMFLQKESLDSAKNKKSSVNVDNVFSKIGEVSESNKEELNEAVDNQNQLFKAKKNLAEGEKKVLQSKLKSVEAQEQAASKKLGIFRQELSLIKPLVEEDNLPILRQFDLEKQIFELEGSVSSLKAEVEIAKKQISNFENENMTKILTELKETGLEIINLANQLTGAKDALKRTEILSPVDGKVMNIKYHTIGAVVQPASEIMDIVPNNDQLIIEAKVKPQDIDSVHQGLKSKVVLTAYDGKKVPKLDSEVISVSADIFINEQTRESYFLARIKIDEKEIAKLKDKATLYPGMPAQVFIITGSRSLLSYLFTPITKASYKAFREN